MKILLVGNPGGTNVADSLLFAARQLKHEVSLVPATDAFRTSDLRRRISWHVLGHKPPRLAAFSQRVLGDARAFQPDVVIATGLAPISADVLKELSGIRRVVFLTDDPWNRDFSAKWFSASSTSFTNPFWALQRAGKTNKKENHMGFIKQFS